MWNCLICGERSVDLRDVCYNCGVKRGNIQNELISNATNDRESYKAKDLTMTMLNALFILTITAIIIFLLLISTVGHYLLLDSVAAYIKILGRSPETMWHMFTVLYWSCFGIFGFLLGIYRMKGLFKNAVQEDRITKLCEWRGKDLKVYGEFLFTVGTELQGFTIVPFPSDIRDNKYSDGYTKIFYKKRCILIPPVGGIDLRKLIGYSSIVLLLLGFLHYSLPYLIPKSLWWIIILTDMIVIAFSSVMGYQLGKGCFKLRIAQILNKGIGVIDGCIYNTSQIGRYIFICPFNYIHKYSVEEAERVCSTYLSVKNDESTLGKWPELLC